MTKKHFQIIAQAIQGIQDTKARKIAAHAMADRLGQANTRFDKPRFLKACGAQ